MRQVILAEPGRFEARDVPPPGDPPDGQVRVRIRRIGVCGTDLHAFTGRQPFFEYPRVLGHELAVEVVQLGNDVEGLAIGDVCAVEPYLNCGDCPMCAVGRTNCCERLRVLGIHIDGGMTDELIVPVDKLYPSKSLTLDQLALVETLGIGRHAVNRARLEIFEPVLVVGAGPIGLATAQFAKAAGAEVTVLDTSPTRRAFAERFGFTVVPETEARFNVVFDATGSRAAMERSIERAAFGGSVVFVGLVKDRVSFDDPLLHRRELTLLASRNSAGAFEHVMSLIEVGAIDTTPWVTHRLTLDEVPARFGTLRDDPALVKAIIEVV
jgi:2-desacetyl-2-hydroxyethyl bacteriochlorophyllide A dehydrogenase